ncbi:hypothetical protein, partial [Kluyvera georgiana]
VKRLISLFSAEILRRTSLTRRLVIRCSVSVEAHYREFILADKRKFKIIYRSLFFSPNCVSIQRKKPRLLFLTPIQYVKWHTKER